MTMTHKDKYKVLKHPTPIATFWKSRGFWASMSLSSVRVIIASFKCSGFHYPEADRCRSVGVTIDSTTIKPSTKNQIYHICVGKEDNISYHLAMTMTCKDKDKYKVLKHLVRVPNLYFGSIQYSWGTWLWNTQSRGFKYINYIWDLHSLFDLVWFRFTINVYSFDSWFLFEHLLIAPPASQVIFTQAMFMQLCRLLIFYR